MKTKTSWLDIPGLPPPDEMLRRSLEQAGYMLLPLPIPVSERLPESLDVFAWSEGQWHHAGCQRQPDGEMRWAARSGFGQDLYGVTHWLPMIPPPRAT